MASSRLLILTLAASLAAAQGASAQSFVRADCQTVIGSTPNRYDTAEHERWYRRFWTGDCAHLPLCIPGAPNWNEITGKLLARAAPGQKIALLPKTCRLGQMIGLEWSRERTVRRINTADLKVFSAILEASADTAKGVDRVEQAARAKLGR